MQVETRIQFRCTKEDKVLLRAAATSLGYRSLSEYIRVAAHQYIRDFEYNQSTEMVIPND